MSTDGHGQETTASGKGGDSWPSSRSAAQLTGLPEPRPVDQERAPRNLARFPSRLLMRPSVSTFVSSPTTTGIAKTQVSRGRAPATSENPC